MTKIAMLFIFILSFVQIQAQAQEYKENIERNGSEVRGHWVSTDNSLALLRGPMRGYFYVSTDTYVTDMSCDDFTAKVKVLIRDWKSYSKINMYSLTSCTVTGSKSTTVFFYGIDLWRQDGLAAHQQFLKDHQGMDFLGRKLDFSPVTSLKVRSALTFAVASGNKLTPVHEAETYLTYQYEDQWYLHHLAVADIITQSDKDIFFNFVETDFGSSEKDAFEQALPSTNFVGFGDYFTLFLTNGKVANMWFGWGENKNCGTTACYASSTLLRPFSLAR